MVKIKEGDKIRDFTDMDESMMLHWRIGGKNYVPYTVLHVGKEAINGVRMASPKYPSTHQSEYKNFEFSRIAKASQTRGIFEYR